MSPHIRYPPPAQNHSYEKAGQRGDRNRQRLSSSDRWGEDTQILQPKVLDHQTDTKSTSIDASDKWSFSNALCTLDRIELLYKLMECARREQKKLRPTSLSHKSDGSQLCITSYSKMEHGMTNTFRQVPPRFHCVPLDDGFIRTLCVSPGSMASLSPNFYPK